MAHKWFFFCFWISGSLEISWNTLEIIKISCTNTLLWGSLISSYSYSVTTNYIFLGNEQMQTTCKFLHMYYSWECQSSQKILQSIRCLLFPLHFVLLAWPDPLCKGGKHTHAAAACLILFKHVALWSFTEFWPKGNISAYVSVPSHTRLPQLQESSKFSSWNTNSLLCGDVQGMFLSGI